MPTATCRSCDSQIRYGPKHAGSAVRCPKCGRTVLLAAIEAVQTIPEEQDPEPGEPGDLAYGIEPDEPAPAPMRMPTTLANTSSQPTQSMPGRLRQGRIQRGFWADARKSFTFLSEMDNAIVVIGYALLMTVYSGFSILPGILGLIFTVFFYGLLFAFYFDIVQTTAGGEDDLPSLMEWDGFIDSALAPMLRFIGTIGVAMLPAVSARILLGWDMSASEAVLVLVLMALGWFFWPVIVLAVSTLGYGLVLRVDLLLRTPFVAFGAYLSVCALLVVALSLEWLGSSAFYSDTSHQLMDAMNVSRGSLPGFLFLVFETFVINAIAISSSVISMRLIGLYYRHFGHRFPWSAG